MAREERDAVRIEPFTLVTDILKNLWVIILGAVAAALLTYVVVSARYVPRYSTSATFAVASRSDSNPWTNLASANEMAQTFERILKSNVMKKTLCQALGVSSIDAQINTQVLSETNLLILKVTDDTPKDAYDTIRAVMENYTSISFYMAGDLVMDVLEEPYIPTSPDNGLNPREDMKTAFIAAAAVMSVLFGLLSYLSNTIKLEEDIEKKLDARSLGVIPYENKYKTLREKVQHKKCALLVNHPLAGFNFVESYKKLATRVDYQMSKEGNKILVVTSVSEDEGKSTVAANLAITLAELGKKVLLVEGDLRRPSQFLIFGKNPDEKCEIGEFLKGNGQVKDILLESGIPRLYLMIGRNCYSSSTELLQSGVLAKLLDACKRTMDYVVIDTPPAGLIGDAEVLASQADAVMVVTKQNFIHAEDINDVLDSFREHHSKVLGVVLNGARTIESTPVGGYYGGYGRYGKYGNYGKSREA